MPFEDILYEKDKGVAKITINRPEKNNSITSKGYVEISEAFNRAEAEGDVGVVVLTGAGDQYFSSGGDVSAHINRTGPNLRLHLGKLLEIAMIMRNMGKPIIAAVNGKCIGGAHQLQLLCDLSIAADHATFGQHGTKRAAAPVFWGMQLLPRMVWERKAREMVLLSREYSAQEALKMHLVNKVVPYAGLYKEVDSWCQELLTISPTALRIGKTSLNYGSDLCYPAIWHGREMMSILGDSQERREGTAAYAAGGRADWSKFRE